MRHFTSRSVRRRQQSTTTNSRSTNQPSVPITLSFTTQGSSSSMISLFGRVLAGSPMLHTQITRLIKHKVVFIRKAPSTCFSLLFSRHPLWFMNSTKHVTHSTHFPAENESVLLNITKLFIRVLCSYCNCCLTLSPSAPCVLLILRGSSQALG